MSFLVNKLAEHAGDMVADRIKGALGVDDKDKKKKKKEEEDGGFLSIFKHEKKKEEPKKKKEDDGFFDKHFKRDHNDDREKIPKRSGFSGLFAEGPDGGATAGPEGDCERCEDLEEKVGDRDIDLMDDLIAVANDSS